MQERVPEGPEPTAAPTRAQPAVEALAAGEGGGGAEEGGRGLNFGGIEFLNFGGERWTRVNVF
ncbi:uncharacterized protein DS421_3g79570 [Arachis hypogaea]|nr:uncharacterized protein DS421_3g79570 [Arachis hypogaea]